MSIKKYNVDTSKKNPFNTDIDNLESIGLLTWDWHYERIARDVRQETIKGNYKLLDIVVNNRTIMQDVFFVTTVDIPNMGVKVNPTLVYFFQGLFSRMVKTSKVIQDLSVQGSYVEAKALIRNNFEKAVLICYFSKNVEEIEEYVIAKKENNTKTLRKKYTISLLSEKIKKDYREYKYLCEFIHPNIHEEDIRIIDTDDITISMHQYNFFQPEELVINMYWNNNLLLESFLAIFNYMKKDLPKSQIPKNLREIMERANKLRIIGIGSKKI